ncbi:MAG: hypothetical protein M0T78_09510 [Actinomycetota bacterium]|nr:hypothetical protein [Actinomycetota bacterium]
MIHHLKSEPRWPATVALGIAITLYVVLPSKLIFGPRFLIPGLEAALLIPLNIAIPFRNHKETTVIRALAVGLILLINLSNLASVALLVRQLLVNNSISGKILVEAAAAIWLTNILVFGLWFWEVDRGGPAKRSTALRDGTTPVPDFLFPQMSIEQLRTSQWRPSFFDYLYLSLTNATAFSPTDTMPLTKIAKALMGSESLVSMVTVLIVAARAVNILP